MTLKNVLHINSLKRFKLPLNKILIVGSGTMALLGIKNNHDLDLWVTTEVFKLLAKHKDFKPVKKLGRLFYESLDGSIEASDKMICTKGKVEDYLKKAIVISGFHFQSLNDVLTWKKCMKRPKDIEDIKKIENHLQNMVVERYLNLLNT